MKPPKSIEPLIEDGLVDEVIRPLMSGKEAAVYVVRRGNEVCCAKAYKTVNERGFRNRAQYTEGRKVRNSRKARAMEKGSRYGRAEQESAWQNAEVEALFLLAAAGVRVPKPYHFVDGVLLMELVVDAEGNAAPRLNDLELSADVAREYHQFLIAQVARMLCAGLIHGDLSEFNVLVGGEGPVIIDLPQAIHAADSNSAFALFERDVNNMAAYFGRFAPELLDTQYASEIWSLYEKGELTPESVLTGQFARDEKAVNVGGVLKVIDDAREEAMRRRAYAEDADR
ncbi:PA4780 family RIO1-like protein kinase [Thermithiobacillus plumbiphilus]|uniref:non-specific serine/threonine protein kinase n=1 Tax=Thermithiobacillus plumbiphilus TaxID=1729899 RepID=A0ABU9D6L3_9PROT